MEIALFVDLDLMSVRASREVWHQAPRVFDGINYSVHDYQRRRPAPGGRFCVFGDAFFARDVCVHCNHPELLPVFRFEDVELQVRYCIRVGTDLRPYICCDSYD